MKSHHLNLWLVFLIALSTSCTSYQFATLKSELPQTSHEGFLYQNDTLEVLYSFNGLNCPVSLNIHNKLNTPILINWSQSAVVINGESYNINPNRSHINTDYSETTVKYNKAFEHTTGSMQSTVTKDDQSGFIPPKSQLYISDFSVISKFLPTESASSESKASVFSDTNQMYQVKSYNFKKEQTPLKFRCFLTYSDANNNNPNRIDHQFWVSSIYKTTGMRLKAKPDRFYVSKASGVGTALGVATVATLVVVGLNHTDADELNEY